MSRRLFLAFLLTAASAAAQAPCGNPPAILTSTQPNIFSEQQEQWLGEAMADYNDRFSRPIKSASQNAYLETIGKRLLAALPPTTLKFRFTMVESSEVNGFSLAGGNIYLTRKLVASARSEDEIAGVIAHEMGHILTHQFAIETTADLRRLLGVTSVTDRADIFAKFQRLIDARQHQKHQTDEDSDDKQDQADRVAVYAAAAAGYRPQAYAEFWDRSFFVGGKTGSRFSDFFGATTPSQKRLRRIQGMITQLPAACGATLAAAPTPEFLKWQQEVLENQGAAPVTLTTSSASELQLTPPLRLDVDRLRFSRDGKYILAQDETSITVLSREPFKQLFRFDAERALPADFTPDSQEVAFATAGLHLERWSLATQKLISAKELVSPKDCLQTNLSPDARTLVCITQDPESAVLGVSLLDASTGAVVWEKKNWFEPSWIFVLSLNLRRATHDLSDQISASFSADGNLLLLGPGEERIAFDLRTRTPVKISGALHEQQYSTSFCFRGNDRVILVSSLSPAYSGIFSFPDGKKLQPLKLAVSSMQAATGSDYVIAPGPPGSVVALDVEAGKYIISSKSPALDVFAGSYVSENLDGTLALVKLTPPNPDRKEAAPPDKKDTLEAELSTSPLASATSVSLSPDGHFLAYSARTRGIIWDLQSGHRVVLSRGFRGAWWTPEGKMLAEFQARDKSPRAIREVNPVPAQARDMPYKLPDRGHLESGHLLEWKQDKKLWTFTASSPADAVVQWTRTFPDGRPDYTTNDGDTDLILSYRLDLTAARDKLRTDATLKAQAAAIKEKTFARLIEVVNSADGTTRAQAVIEVPRSYGGVDGFNRVGDLLYHSTGDNRTIVYSLTTGAQLRQFFGNVMAADQDSGVICTANRRGETIVLDKSGAELKHLNLTSPVRFAALRDHGTQLLVLTADQRIHRIDLTTPAGTK